MGGSWRRRMGESLGKTGAPTMLYENLDLLTWSLQISTPCALAYFTATNPLPAVPISHPTPPAPAAGRILPVPRVVRENGPGRPRITPPARTLASRLPTLSQLFPSHVPHPLHPLQVEFYWYHGWCARTSRVAPESPPPALTLASRPPTLSQLFPSHVLHPLHPLQVNFYRYDGWCARTDRVASDSLPLRARSLHPLYRVRDCWKQADELAG